MTENRLKITAIILMSLLSIITHIHFLRCLHTQLFMINALIPDYAIEQVSHEHLVNGLFSAIPVVICLPFFFKKYYKVTITILFVSFLFARF